MSSSPNPMCNSYLDATTNIVIQYRLSRNFVSKLRMNLLRNPGMERYSNIIGTIDMEIRMKRAVAF